MSAIKNKDHHDTIMTSQHVIMKQKQKYYYAGVPWEPTGVLHDMIKSKLSLTLLFTVFHFLFT